MRIGWLLPSKSFELASARYRCFYPAYGLSLRGHESRFFDNPAEATAALTDLDALVIVKRLDTAMLALAARARDTRVPVVFDLCDDIISPGYRPDLTDLNLMLLAGLAAGTDLIVTTGLALSERLRTCLPLWTHVTEIPDVAETPDLLVATRGYLGVETRAPVAAHAPRPPRLNLRGALYVATHPLWAARRAVGNTLRHRWTVRAYQYASRMIYRLRHPDQFGRQLRRAWRDSPTALALRVGVGRTLFVLRRPDWIASRLARMLRNAPLLARLRRDLGRTAYAITHPAWWLRKAVARVAGLPMVRGLRRDLGRTAYAITHPVWWLRKAVARISELAGVRSLRTGLGRAAYGFTHPVWWLRKAVARVTGLPMVRGLRRDLGRTAYAITHPVWWLRKAVARVSELAGVRSLRTGFGRAAYVLTHPLWALRKLMHATASAPLARRCARGARRAWYAIRHPRWALRKTAHRAASHPMTRRLLTGAGRILYGVSHPVWVTRRAAHAIASSAASRGTVKWGRRGLWRLTHPRSTLGRLGAFVLLSPPLAPMRILWRLARPQPARPPLGALSRAPESEIIQHPTAQASEADPATSVPEAPPSVVWFGNHGGPYSNFGMLSLLAVAPPLRRVLADIPFELVVISNDQKKFDAVIARMGIPARYVPWSAEAVHGELARASAAILTTGDDDFSRVKSANRAALCLTADVPVVAPAGARTGVLTELARRDFEDSLRAYLSDPDLRRRDVERGRRLVEERFGLTRIVDRWESALEETCRQAVQRRERTLASPTLLFVIDLIQDLNILLPVLDAAMARDMTCLVVLSEHAARSSRRTLDALAERRIIPTLVEAGQLARLDARWLRNADVVITAAESSNPAHRVSHAFACLGNDRGLRTVQLQHGYEAPGLSIPPPRPISIASQTILTWQSPDRMPRGAAPDVIARCVGVGRPKLRIQRLPISAPPRVIGVFENLHWERYTQEYRMSFLDHLCRAAEARPDFEFLVRPHPAGRWFLDKAPHLSPSNIRVSFDPQNPDLPPVELFIAGVSAVITTPSTVAVDACEARRPTAIFQGDLPALDPYAPLPLLRGVEDWLEFLQRVDEGDPFEEGASFMDRVALPGDGAEAAAEYLRRELGGSGAHYALRLVAS